MTEITRPQAARLPVPALRRAGETAFSLRPDAEWLAALTRDLDLLGLRKLRLDGAIEAAGDAEMRLTARLGATLVQPCVVTLEPVTTRIEAEVIRRYLRDLPEPEGDEVEMPEDDSLEALGSHIDLAALLSEALALNLPLYPRAEGVEFPGGDDPGDEDGTRRPFASLAALKPRSGDGGTGI